MKTTLFRTLNHTLNHTLAKRFHIHVTGRQLTSRYFLRHSTIRRARAIPFVCLALATIGGLTGCGNSQTQVQPTAATVQSQTSATPVTNLQHTAAKSDTTTALHPVVYGPPLPSPAELAAIQSRFVLQPAPQEIPILMYHSISDHPKNTLCVPPARFALEMKHLYDAGYHTIGFDDLKNAWLNHQPLPKKPIIITFDDGYEDNYQAAYPVLKRYNLRATIFIITRFVGASNTLTWDQIRFMDQQGLVQFGSHTVDHLDLSHLTETQQRYEIQQSKAVLEQQLGHPVIAFCYPSGRYNATTIQLLQQAGFTFAVTTQPGFASLTQGQWTLHRVRVSGDESVAEFDNVLS